MDQSSKYALIPADQEQQYRQFLASKATQKQLEKDAAETSSERAIIEADSASNQEPQYTASKTTPSKRAIVEGESALERERDLDKLTVDIAGRMSKKLKRAHQSPSKWLHF
jgi:hypothetical protein